MFEEQTAAIDVTETPMITVPNLLAQQIEFAKQDSATISTTKYEDELRKAIATTLYWCKYYTQLHEGLNRTMQADFEVAAKGDQQCSGQVPSISRAASQSRAPRPQRRVSNCNTGWSMPN